MPWEPEPLALGVNRRAAFELRDHPGEISIRQLEMLGRTHSDAIARDERSRDLRTRSQRLESSECTQAR